MNTQKEKLVYHADEVEKKREGLHAFARNHRLFARQQKTLLLRTHILYMYICMCHMLSTIRALTISMKNTFFHSVYLPPLPLSPSTSLSLSFVLAQTLVVSIRICVGFVCACFCVGARFFYGEIFT